MYLITFRPEAEEEKPIERADRVIPGSPESRFFWFSGKRAGIPAAADRSSEKLPR
jgi:hypothetical protein